MKKILLAYGALVVVVIVLAFVKFNGTTFFSNFGNGATATIGTQKFNLEIARDDKSRQIGLSNRKSLDLNKGMLFLFEKKGIYSFWMKRTLIPLDIIYIDNDKIVYIVKNAKPEKDVKGTLPIYTPTVQSDKVLEINGGLADKYNFKNGDVVKITGVK